MTIRLTEREIGKRLQRLRNYERLYPELKKKYEELKKENRELRAELMKIKKESAEKIETLELRVEELAKMIFSKTMERKKPRDEKDDFDKRGRAKTSYRREQPKDSEVTNTYEHRLFCCPDCGGEVIDVKVIERFVEDMRLATGEKDSLKLIEKHLIETGYCVCCKKKVSAKSYGSQTCELGENIKLFVSYALTILGLTYEKVKHFLRDVYGISISDGEIASILHRERNVLLREKDRIAMLIRSSPAAHYDETGYPVQSEEQGKFAWVKTSSSGEETLFSLGKSRGKGNAEILRGDQNGQVGMSDDYAAYDHIFENHALCWAHPKRKFEELAHSGALSKKKRAHCQRFYARFRLLYTDVAQTRQTAFDSKKREWMVRNIFLPAIEKLFLFHHFDPKKLATLKKSFLKNKEKYMVCLLKEGVPMDNNKAERALRPLVIKRKISFGSKTQKGADTMGVLMSALFTLWWKKPKNFFAEYRKIRATA